jgi:glycosyltransferase involved in cell wall biosynthesis
LKPGDLVLFFMGWIYNFSGVLKVAQSLHDLPDHVKLLVVGDGDQYESLCRLRDEALPERLILTGRVPYEQISRLIQAADVCILPFERVPATEHIVPIKLYEYMAAAKPVIAAPLPGVQLDVGDTNGVHFAPALEQAAFALQIASDAETLGRLARRFVEINCDWRTITDSFEKLLTQHLTPGR